MTMTQKNLAVFYLLFACVYLACTQQEVLNKCVTMPVGNLCIEITSQQCFELTGQISLDGATVFGPQIVPIGSLLTEIQNRVDDPNFANSDHMICQPIGTGVPGIDCSLCATVDQLHVSGDTLHYCGSGLVNCTGILEPTNFTIPCIEITNCKLFGCRNDCNGAGRCTSIGICRCKKNHYGLDCSIAVDKNCVSAPFLSSPTCWTADFPDCRTVDLSITTNGITDVQHYKLDEISSFPVVPCQNFLQDPTLQCDICIDMVDITVVGDQLNGCPTIKTSCNSIPVSDNQIDCVTLAKTPKLQCPAVPTLSDDSTFLNDTGFFVTSRTGRTILMVLASVIGVLFFLGLGYFVLTKYLGVYLPNPFDQGHPEVYVEDEAPLNAVDDEDLQEEAM